VRINASEHAEETFAVMIINDASTVLLDKRLTGTHYPPSHTLPWGQLLVGIIRRRERIDGVYNSPQTAAVIGAVSSFVKRGKYLCCFHQAAAAESRKATHGTPRA
jgi:hypothetical protein